MSYMVKKIHLDGVKGMAYFGKYLAEDFFLAKYLHDKYARSHFMVLSETISSSVYPNKENENIY